MNAVLKLSLIILILGHSAFGQAAEYVLPYRMNVYDATGKPIKPIDYPVVELPVDNWGGPDSWFFVQSKSPVSIAANGVTVMRLTTGAGQPIYMEVGQLRAVAPELRKNYKGTVALETCGACAQSNRSNPTGKTIDTLLAAQNKVSQSKAITLNGYKSKVPDFTKEKRNGEDDFSACSSVVQHDGSLGPIGQAIVEEMIASKDSFTKENNNILAVCPKFNSLSPEKKFDFNLWLIMSLMAQESMCNPRIKSQAYNADGSCFNAPNRRTNCQQAFGLCQLNQNTSGYGCQEEMRNGGMLVGANNAKCCTRIIRDQNIEGGSVIGRAGNHFGPFNAPKSKPKFMHFIDQWRSECY